MAARGLSAVLIGIGLMLGGCMNATVEPASEANLTPRDKKLLAAAPYESLRPEKLDELMAALEPLAARLVAAQDW